MQPRKNSLNVLILAICFAVIIFGLAFDSKALVPGLLFLSVELFSESTKHKHNKGMTLALCLPSIAVLIGMVVAIWAPDLTGHNGVSITVAKLVMSICAAYFLGWNAIVIHRLFHPDLKTT